MGQGRIKVLLVLLAEISHARTPISSSNALKIPYTHCLATLVSTLLEKSSVEKEKGDGCRDPQSLS